MDRDEPDADKLLIVAGPFGSGRLSILQASCKENLLLFAADNQILPGNLAKTTAVESVRNSRKLFGRSYLFQVWYVKVLMLEDLYQVLLEINPSCYRPSMRISEAWRAFWLKRNSGKLPISSKRGKRSFASLQVPSENDQIMRFYLGSPFFKRFKHIVVNTVCCDFSDTARQLSARKEKRIARQGISERRRSKYFLAPDSVAQSIHQELYASWERNLVLLDPTAVFTTEVSESGDLLLNGSLLSAGWSKRFQRIS